MKSLGDRAEGAGDDLWQVVWLAAIVHCPGAFGPSGRIVRASDANSKAGPPTWTAAAFGLATLNKVASRFRVYRILQFLPISYAEPV